MANMSTTSRYRYNREYEDSSGFRYLDEREPFKYREEADNRFYQVRDGDSWWSLAHRFYGHAFPRAAGLWWIIAEFQPQPVADPTARLVAGTTVVIPSDRLVRNAVFSPERREDH
jgi:hypothetical protein